MNTILYPRKVQYYETDQMGVVHHSNYIRWFEEARIAFMDAVGFTYKQMEDEGIISPVLEVQATYRSMVRFGDEVNIATSLTAFNGIRMEIAYHITDAATGEVRTTGMSRHCFLDSNGRPLSLKHSRPDIYNLFLKCV